MKKEAEEAKKAKEAEERVRKEAELAAKEKAKTGTKEARERAKGEAEEAQKAEDAVVAELFEGIVDLVILPPVDLGQMKELEKSLHQIQDLRVVLISGSVDKGTKVVVSARKPVPLVSVVSEMPLVEQVVKKGEKIQISLRAKL